MLTNVPLTNLLRTNLKSLVREPRRTYQRCKPVIFTTGMLNRFRPERQLLGLHCPGLNPGRSFHEVTAFLRDQMLEKTRLFPKSNRMTHAPHGVKVETQVVDCVQDLRQHFI
jgi:hypothetical protein